MHHLHSIQRRFLSIAAEKRKAVKKFGVPEAILSIPDPVGYYKGNAGAVIRQLGGTRRIFLLKPELTPTEVEGLAYRIRTLSRNECINSVLIATDDRDDANNGALPTMLLDRDHTVLRYALTDLGFPVAPGKTWHVSQGYDPLALYKNRTFDNLEKVQAHMMNVSSLTMAIRGDPRTTKVPVVCMPHGLVTDAGFAFCMSTHVMATRETCVRILNPSRGLSLDPVGLSYVLPRLGHEFDQPAASFPGCGMILGLMGYEADASDMLETGLATHYCETATVLGQLEFALSQIRPWMGQAYLKEPYRFEGDPVPRSDYNAEFRNESVAECIHCFSTYSADGRDLWSSKEKDAINYYELDDPSLEFETIPRFADRVSDLVNYAATFDDIFSNERTLDGILERLKEIAARQTKDPEEQEGIDVAADFVRRLESQSPLAVSVVFELIRAGSRNEETLESCLERERRVQTKMMAQLPDFEKWAAFTSSAKHRAGESEAPFSGWKHKDIASVTKDEVLEIIEAPLQHN